MATRPFLVVILSRKTPFFWRRDSFSSSFFGRKLHFLATKPILVVTLSRKMLIFGDEALSRRHFEPKNFTFWRRGLFSSSF
ncbi:hypothetical protein [Caldibacillus thermoamylovorans]|uniref:hypothetical protein n=1 Tax=Caldibacillus thermoamylovorans TaxID=35841 RepID=UPI0022E23409|nr:hypothetical protein [Caldibacillus thermoamylovorans]